MLETLVASKIEEVVTKNKMEIMYFDANLNGLINELLKYSNEETIITFIHSLDFLSTLYLETDIEKDFSVLDPHARCRRGNVCKVTYGCGFHHSAEDARKKYSRS